MIETFSYQHYIGWSELNSYSLNKILSLNFANKKFMIKRLY